MREGRILLVLVLLMGPSGEAGAVAQELPAGLGLAAAVRLALAHDPNVALQQAKLEAAEGALAVAADPFDPLLTSTTTNTDSRDPGVPEHRELATTVLLHQRLRSGLVLEPELRLDRMSEAGEAGDPANLGTITFRLRQPLLRGRGALANDAGERAARHEFLAVGFEVRQLVAGRLARVVTQYWTTAAAARSLAVQRESEERARELLRTTRQLVEGDQVPAAELVQLEANLAAQESATIGAERDLFAARQELGREIGLDAPAIAGLDLPSEPFPEVTPEALPEGGALAPWIAAARLRRGDLRAARERREAAEQVLRAADLALLPQLDLVLAPNYSGAAEGRGPSPYLSSFYRNVPGLGATLSLELSWSPRNRLASGQRAQRESALRQIMAVETQVALEIAATVPAAVDAVRRDAERMAKARQAVRLFERAVGNEEKKLRAGTSTLLDLLSQRDRWTAARQVEVQAELDLALALLQLRFTTGSLLDDGEGPSPEAPEAGESSGLDIARLTTIPDLGEGGRP